MGKVDVSVFSEIGELEGVILHTPGAEVENMTPENAQRALYSDILNLNVARKEYSQLSGVLSKVAKVYQVADLLEKVLEDEENKEYLIEKICRHENAMSLYDNLLDYQPKELSRLLIEGVPIVRNTLTNFLSKERFSLRPLYNFYFTRDASIAIGEDVLIGKMANAVRDRESIIMEAIFSRSGVFNTHTINPTTFSNPSDITIEGGDVLVVRDDILLVGNGTRTNTHGIDFILNRFLARNEKKRRHILVQELPHKPESFIHLDMVFTMLDYDKCMVYEPIILQPNRYQTVQITIDNGVVKEIKTVDNLLVALKSLGIDLKPVFCGGSKDRWIQEREQWHSGANFVAIGPGKVIGYGRNINTLDEMNRNGFEILKAKDIVSGKVDVNSYSKYVVALDGSELPRGGGGARCMTMPFKRKPLKW
ncbi:arginine deiminase [Tenuifilum thalassicum]|uniref:arginine deiminase n=1 Tax=Tenuifilum thalassicum TaxID=2590900 RepID=A0A7D4BL21_9BACT|nr:arginine deiminase family protein [Tenuifilum thalassicum]QKG80659.1 arginine deiminase [Tenuifilum thalassicum]